MSRKIIGNPPMPINSIGISFLFAFLFIAGSFAFAQEEVYVWKNDDGTFSASEEPPDEWEGPARYVPQGKISIEHPEREVIDEPNVHIERFDVKRVGASSNYYRVSFKVEAIDYGKPCKMFATIQGLDKNDFAVDSYLLSGHLKRNQYKIISEVVSVPRKQYRMIQGWRISEATCYP